MKVIVEINKNGHIVHKDEIIAILGQWNKYEDLPKPAKRKKND